jgi:hypothetical protein
MENGTWYKVDCFAPHSAADGGQFIQYKQMENTPESGPGIFIKELLMQVFKMPSVEVHFLSFPLWNAYTDRR